MMTTMRWLRLTAVVILCGVSPRGAAAQQLPTAPADTGPDSPSATDRAHGRVGKTARVFLHEGRSPADLVGPLLRFGPETLTILLSGTPREISLADVVRVDVAGDSLKNGAIIGAALLGGWWHIKRQSGSHRTLAREAWPDLVFAFHDDEEIGHRMLARIAKRGLDPNDL